MDAVVLVGGKGEGDKKDRIESGELQWSVKLSRVVCVCNQRKIGREEKRGGGERERVRNRGGGMRVVYVCLDVCAPILRIRREEWVHGSVAHVNFHPGPCH